MPEALGFRSNVVIIWDNDDASRRRARASLPGDVATDVLSRTQMNERQFHELRLYPPCVSCHRSLWQIARQGCAWRCQSWERAQALLGPLEMFEATDVLRDEAGPDGNVAEVEDVDGRGRISAIPEWRPDLDDTRGG